MDKSDKYKFVKYIGSGTFGSVSLYNSEKGLVCIKKIQMPNKTIDRKMVKGELYIISQVKHPNVVKFIDVFIKDNFMNIVMEFASHGTLRDLVWRHVSPFTKKQIVTILCDLLMGLEYLHIRHVIHRDLKPENILIDNLGRVKIADFGISYIHARNKIEKHVMGTLSYLAPEVIKKEQNDFKADVWSLGCILFELCARQSPFATAKDREHLLSILCRPHYHHVSCKSLRYGEDLQTLCEQMLTFNPTDRISIPEIITNILIALTFYDLYFRYY